MRNTKVVNTTCVVATPIWHLDDDNKGFCQKYLPFRIIGTGKDYFLCSETKLPCPLYGVWQFPKPADEDTPEHMIWVRMDGQRAGRPMTVSRYEGVHFV